MRIEEGKTYRAANGEKIGPMVATGRIFIREFGDGFSWSPEGACYVAGDEEPEGWNLISEWTESPVRTVTRQEIIPGTYDGVVVSYEHDHRLTVHFMVERPVLGRPDPRRCGPYGSCGGFA